MRIGIVGIRGFIGRHIAARITADGHITVPIERDWQPRDIVDADVDALIYAGGPSIHVERIDSIDVGDLLAEWIRLLAACATAAMDHVIFLSSHAAYGQQAGLPISEDAQLRPRSFYGALQASREHIGQAFWHIRGLPFTSIRLGTVYGHGMRDDALIQVFIRAALAGGEIRLTGNGSQIRPFVHIDDATDLISRVIEAGRGVGGEAFNGASAHATVASVAALVTSVAQSLGRPPVRFVEGARRLGDPHDVILADARVRTALKWCPTVTLVEGITRTVTAATRGGSASEATS